MNVRSDMASHFSNCKSGLVEETRKGLSRMSGMGLDLAVLACWITAFKPASTRSVQNVFSAVNFKDAPLSADWARCLICRMASFRSTRVSRFSSSGHRMGKPEERMERMRKILRRCLVVCMGQSPFELKVEGATPYRAGTRDGKGTFQ